MNPYIVDIPSGVWVLVAEIIDRGTLIILKPETAYFATYVISGDPPPDDSTVRESQRLTALEADIRHCQDIDVYVQCPDEIGKVLIYRCGLPS